MKLQMTGYISQLPIVVLDDIIKNLDPKSILALRATNEILAKAVESNAERLLKRYLVALKTTYSSVTRLLALMSHVLFTCQTYNNYVLLGTILI